MSLKGFANIGRDSHIVVRGEEKTNRERGAETSQHDTSSLGTETRLPHSTLWPSVSFHSFVGEVRGRLGANSAPAPRGLGLSAQPQEEAPTPPRAATGWNPLGHRLLSF